MRQNDYLLLGAHITPDDQDPVYIQKAIDNYDTIFCMS